MIQYTNLNPFSKNESIEIYSGTNMYDLHNAADLLELNLNINELTFNCIWDFGSDIDKYKGKLKLSFEGISKIDVQGNIDKSIKEEIKCLEYLKENNGNEIELLFRNEILIKIKCDKVRLELIHN